MMVYRKVIQDNFQMDINHFLGMPGLSFNIMLKISKVKLELISDPEMCEFFRKSIRRGMSFIATRKANPDQVHIPIVKSGVILAKKSGIRTKSPESAPNWEHWIIEARYDQSDRPRNIK